MYPVITARCAEDPAVAERARAATFDLQNGRAGYVALWQHFHDVSVSGQKKDFAGLDVEFDVWYGGVDRQRSARAAGRQLLESGVARESDGAVIVDVARLPTRRRCRRSS